MPELFARSGYDGALLRGSGMTELFARSGYDGALLRWYGESGECEQGLAVDGLGAEEAVGAAVEVVEDDRG